MSGNDNPGNFANRSEDDVKNVASKGGQTGTENSGFASMAKDKVVCLLSTPRLVPATVLTATTARDCIAGRKG